MRQTLSQIGSIKQVAAEVIGGQARLLWFGSRADDARRGSDNDLYVAAPVLPLEAQLQARLKFLVMLKQQDGCRNCLNW